MKPTLCSAMSALALIGCSVPVAGGPERVTELRPDARVQPRGGAVLQRAMLDGHNDARRAAGVPALGWSDELASDAARYAAVLAETRTFRHSVEPRGRMAEGENLFTGTRGAYSYREMVDLWVAEKKDFVNRPTPDFSRTGNYADVAHFTQIVWRGTSQVGCALASNARDDYLVCRYTPPGNVVGQRAF